MTDTKTDTPSDRFEGHTPGPWDNWPNADSDKLLGYDIINLLGLTTKPNGRVDTSWGDKTPQGLGATVRRIVGEAGPDLLAERDRLKAELASWIEDVQSAHDREDILREERDTARAQLAELREAADWASEYLAREHGGDCNCITCKPLRLAIRSIDRSNRE